MFYNQWHKTWELPGENPQEPAPSLKLTEHPCPVCGEKLAEREYEKDGQKKRMLVCSSPQARTDKRHQGVVYFESRDVFWSKKHGEIPLD
jgi:DNA topoisomerase-1